MVSVLKHCLSYFLHIRMLLYIPRTRADAVLSLKFPRLAWLQVTVILLPLKPAKSYRITRSGTTVKEKIPAVVGDPPPPPESNTCSIGVTRGISHN